MSKYGIIKTLIVVTIAVAILISGTGPNTHYSIIISIIPPFLFGLFLTLIIGFVASQIKSTTLVKPQWRDSILTFKKPLSLVHFFGYLLIAIGLCLQFGQLYKDGDFNQAGILFGTLGAGVISGVWITLKIK